MQFRSAYGCSILPAWAGCIQEKPGIPLLSGPLGERYRCSPRAEQASLSAADNGVFFPLVLDGYEALLSTRFPWCSLPFAWHRLAEADPPAPPPPLLKGLCVTLILNTAYLHPTLLSFPRGALRLRAPYRSPF